MNAYPAWLRWRRPALAAGLAVVAVVVIVASVPPARAWATTVLRQIGIVSLVEQASPRPAPDPNADPLPTATPIPLDRPAVLTTVEQVAAAAGFRPLLPGKLPEGYAQSDLGVMEYIDDGMRSEGLGTFFRYTSAANGGFFEVQQSRFNGEAPREVAIGDAPVVDVTVRSLPGVWLTDLPWANRSDETLHMLLWWEDGFVFAVQTDTLTLDAVLAVAESLAP